MARNRVESPEVRRGQIISAARDILIEKGYGEVLLDDVAKRADVAKGTLYLYFNDKPSLYGAVMEGLLDDLAARLNAAVSSHSESPIEAVRATVKEMLGFTDIYKDVFLACAQASPVLNRRVNDTLRHRLDRHINLLGSILQTAVKKKALREHEAKTGGMFVIALTRMFMMRKLFQRRPEPMVTWTDEFMDLLLNGLGAEKGK